MRWWLPEMAALSPAPEAAAPGWRCAAEPTCNTPDFGCKVCIEKAHKAGKSVDHMVHRPKGAGVAGSGGLKRASSARVAPTGSSGKAKGKSYRGVLG